MLDTMQNNPLLDLIKTRIAEEGPLSIAEYMSLCLGHPEHGYYMKRDPLGAGGDFTTSPEISQIFGELMGLWCADMFHQLGLTEATLVELGPGRGTLMHDALRATKAIPKFHDAIDIAMVETSPTLANTQYNRLREAHPRIQWLDSVEQLPQKPLLIIANEFFDALPIKQLVKTANGLEERKVDWDEEAQSLKYVMRPQGIGLAKGDDGLAEGAIIESCPAAREVMHTLSSHIAKHGGAALIVDYGYIGDAHSDTLQAVKAHSFASVLSDPGNADLTAHVSFSALKEVAHSNGLATFGAIEQGVFLQRLGAELRLQALCKNASPEQQELLQTGLQRLIAPDQMGELFKVLAVTSSPQAYPGGF